MTVIPGLPRSTLLRRRPGTRGLKKKAWVPSRFALASGMTGYTEYLNVSGRVSIASPTPATQSVSLRGSSAENGRNA